ncbi:hypothetical protein FGO68_gene5331 [Halteria grandinella]|uniref:Uncharacterized protein n=1 Tax=Halteria grandinella TaxID=5974 RepID=A0A8J8P3L2_HALGN|nr:hypothetical protein FGO68_gene5331 [Halteria grandinella]
MSVLIILTHHLLSTKMRLELITEAFGFSQVSKLEEEIFSTRCVADIFMETIIYNYNISRCHFCFSSFVFNIDHKIQMISFLHLQYYHI